MIFGIFVLFITIDCLYGNACPALSMPDILSLLPDCTPHYFVVKTSQKFFIAPSVHGLNIPTTLSFSDGTLLEVKPEQSYRVFHDGTHLRKKLCWFLIFYFDRLPSTLIALEDLVKTSVLKYFNRFHMNALDELEKSRNPENIFTILVIPAVEEREKLFTFLKTHIPDLAVVLTFNSGKSRTIEICWPAISETCRFNPSAPKNCNLAAALKNIPPPKEWYYDRKDDDEYSEKEVFLKFGSKGRNPFEMLEIHDYIVYTITRKVNASLYNYTPKGASGTLRREQVCNASTREICPIPRIR